MITVNAVILIGVVWVLKGSCQIMKKRFSWYTVPQTWNEAWYICNRTGGQLYKEDTPDKTALLDLLINRPPWSDVTDNRTSFWIGLFLNDTVATKNRFMWTDCSPLGSYEDWHPSEPKFDGKRCVYKRGTIRNWENELCSNTKEFICEYGKGQCSFGDIISIPDTSGKVFPGTYTIQTSVMNCYMYCDINNCLAFAFNGSLCILYYNQNPFYYDDDNNTVTCPGYTLYIRRFYEATIGTLSGVSTMNGNSPNVKCTGSIGALSGSLYETFTDTESSSTLLNGTDQYVTITDDVYKETTNYIPFCQAMLTSSTVSDDICPCRCVVPSNQSINMTEIENEIKRIQKELKLDKKDLSVTKRKFISVHDNRMSSVVIGIIFSVTIGGIMLFFLLTDVIHVIKVIRIRWK